MTEYAVYALVLFALGAYVVLDGYDLGIGILTLFDRDHERRRRHTELVATVWDANESWIVLVGVLLWGALPGAYATVLPGAYLPLITMLLAFVLRGVGLELQSAAADYRRGWSTLFGAASLLVTLCQGLVIGTVLSGLPNRGGVFDGNALHWFSPYSIGCALGLTVLYALAGAAWLQTKTEGGSRDRAARLGRPLLLATGAAALALGLCLTSADPQRLQLGQPLRVTLFGLAVAAALVCGAIAWYGFGRRPDVRPFAAVLGAEVAGLLALAAVTAPVVVPPDLTVAAAASPHGSQLFVLIGVGGCMPVVLAYNTYAWWVFRGKYREQQAAVGLPAPAAPAAEIAPTPPPVAVSALRTTATVLRRTALTVLGIAVAAVAQDVFGAHGTWIGPLGICLAGAVSVTAWVVSDRRSAADGTFGTVETAGTGSDTRR